MATLGDNVVWPCLIKTIWARKLTTIASRDGGEAELPEAWSRAIATAWQRGWDLDGVVPLRAGGCGHRWAIVVSRTSPSATMGLIHGSTPLEALIRTPPVLVGELVVDEE